MKVLLSVILFATLGLTAGEDAKSDLPRVRLVTVRGDIEIELFEDDAPNTVANFIELAEKRFFDGLTFHEVNVNWVQSGDPTGTGRGGAGYKFKHEINAESLGLDKITVKEFAAKFKQNAPQNVEKLTLKELYERQGYKYLPHGKSHPVTVGAVAMAHQQPDSNRSQFFIAAADCSWLNGKHTVFGRVVAGLDFLTKIKKGDRIDRVEVLRKREHPYRVVTLEETTDR